MQKSGGVGGVAAVRGLHRGERLAVVVEGGRLQDDAEGADEAGRGEDPQEQAVQHHGHVLPVLDDLNNTARGVKAMMMVMVMMMMMMVIFCI